jgi:hypothetical protein
MSDNKLPKPLRGPLNMGCLVVIVIILGVWFLNSTSSPSGSPSPTTCELIGVPGGAAPTMYCHP